MQNKNTRNPWAWVPSLYFAQGVPYMLVIVVSTTMYKRLGISNSDIAFYTSLLYLPWVIKPFWSPFIDAIFTNRWWVIATQFLMAVLMAATAHAIGTSAFFSTSIFFMWMLAFSSATHDIAADGFYMHGLDTHQQSFFVGIRNTAWRIAYLAGQGGIVVFAGYLESKYQNNDALAWQQTFYLVAAVFLAISIYHQIIIPRPEKPKPAYSFKAVMADLSDNMQSFLQKKNLLIALIFILLYRLGEAQLVKMIAPFMLDPIELGGLGMTTTQQGLLYGTIGTVFLIIGGIVGGVLAAKYGLKKMIWYMAFAMNLPNLLYVIMAFTHPESMITIGFYVSLEQLGYGFGFTAFTLYILQFAQGKHQTTHYAIATGFMALGMMLPGMVSGWIQEYTNYLTFFVWVAFCSIPGLLIIPFLHIDPEFGKKKQS